MEISYTMIRLKSIVPNHMLISGTSIASQKNFRQFVKIALMDMD